MHCRGLSYYLRKHMQAADNVKRLVVSTLAHPEHPGCMLHSNN